ncbi:hypothetical protein F511_42490 [Dorcoceras hygrometricum]|uniref:Uncharacterized protein n=1 Tax=Dorcoceras hygrometricum TaxID=472368 RepID=A0A2Z7CKS9_9LAMI|nr:hypothetical protein F511_42490 [Dorcoceras hygrometricum]
MRIRPPEFETSICDAKYHVSLSTRSVLGKCVYLVTLAMSLFDLQDVCIAIGSIATLDLPMVVDLIGIYGLKGPYSAPSLLSKRRRRRRRPPCAAAAAVRRRRKFVSGQLDEENPFVQNSSVLLVQDDEGVSVLVVDRIGDIYRSLSRRADVIVTTVGARHKCQQASSNVQHLVVSSIHKLLTATSNFSAASLLFFISFYNRYDDVTVAATSFFNRYDDVMVAATSFFNRYDDVMVAATSFFNRYDDVIKAVSRFLSISNADVIVAARSFLHRLHRFCSRSHFRMRPVLFPPKRSNEQDSLRTFSSRYADVIIADTSSCATDSRLLLFIFFFDISSSRLHRFCSRSHFRMRPVLFPPKRVD